MTRDSNDWTDSTADWDEAEWSAKLTEWRRDLHAHPESGWLEYRTASFIASQLQQWGYDIYVGEQACKSSSRMGVPPKEVLLEHERRALREGADPYWVEQMKGGMTAVIGKWQSKQPGPVIAFRFDIDSNDLSESSDMDHLPANLGFRSWHPGMMHACGHDGHAAIGLGVARALSRARDELKGEIRFIFQPAEEGCRGAKSIVDAGWLDGVDYFFGAHIGLGSRTLGEVVASTYGYLATTKLNVVFRGKAAHAGEQPEAGRNALLAAASAALHLHAIPRHSQGVTQLNAGKLAAGTGRNVVPDIARMELETRGETSELDDYMVKEAMRRIQHAALMHGVEAEVEIAGKGPGGIPKSEAGLALVHEAAKYVSGIQRVVDHRKMHVSEDVVFMLNRVREQGGTAQYMLLGSELAAGHHQTTFDFNELVLPLGVQLFTQIAKLCSRDWESKENE